MEVLEVVNRMKRTNLGLGTLLEMCYHDNKGRLSFKGPIDVAADAIGQPAFITYIRCVHGHHSTLADTFDPEEIAVGWLSPSTPQSSPQRSLQPEALNPKTEAPIPNPEALTPKPYPRSPNPTPEALNPKPKML